MRGQHDVLTDLASPSSSFSCSRKGGERNPPEGRVGPREGRLENIMQTLGDRKGKMKKGEKGTPEGGNCLRLRRP